MAQFKKGQTVYQACGHFASKGNDYTMAVIERVVDGCGKKVLTFLERGEDEVFGKSARASSDGKFYRIFATADEAVEALKAGATDNRFAYYLIDGVQSDGDTELFSKLRSGKLQTKRVTA